MTRRIPARWSPGRSSIQGAAMGLHKQLLGHLCQQAAYLHTGSLETWLTARHHGGAA
ncbi:hypothetical protein [Phytopseudomonas flavescens]|uniref:hypothetical protein n=1 Tax=Phytopseudomonas flavescens TaxID=29435 RepID=UPI001428B93C|nr:hypothetical protein [Pseudomonas flavescens]